VDKVSELIDGDTHQWDLQKLLTNKFSQVDIDRIMQISISGIAGEDWTAWAYEKSGLFTVKSAYRMLVSQPREQQGRAATSSSNGKEGFVEEFVEAESGTEGACILVSGYARHYARLLNPHPTACQR
jgi:hypothetical protein